MKTIYIANDGKNFDDYVTCREYEEEVDRKNAERKKKEEEKEEAFKEVLKKKCEYYDALNEYESKYNDFESMNCRSSFIDFSDFHKTLRKLGLA